MKVKLMTMCLIGALGVMSVACAKPKCPKDTTFIDYKYGCVSKEALTGAAQQAVKRAFVNPKHQNALQKNPSLYQKTMNEWINKKAYETSHQPKRIVTPPPPPPK